MRSAWASPASAAAWAAAYLTLGCGAAMAQNPPQLVRFASTADGSEQTYALYSPRELVVNRRYPLVISLHGEEASPQLNLRQLLGSKLLRVDPSDPRFYPVAREVDYFVAVPSARGTFGYRGLAESDVYDALADLEQRNPIDPDRVYLTGIGMGGGGALWYALTRPDIWAGVAPLSAEVIPGSEELAGNALDLPVRLYHGDQDPIVPASSSRLWQRLLLDAGGMAEYLEYPGARHNTWDWAYKNGALFDWFGQFRRQRFPAHVRFATRSYAHSAAYWVRIDGLTPGELAQIDASIGAKQDSAGVRVETKNVDGFSLYLDRAVEAVTINGSTVRVKAGTEQSFTRVAGAWRAGRYTPAGKQPGTEGPISAAFDGGQTYVYGTMSARDDADLEERRRTADKAAHWGSVNFPVHNDYDETHTAGPPHNLVLFGTKQTNSLVRSLDLPLELHAGAADYGLLFIAPAGNGRYIVVSSGLPWWTGAPEVNRGGDRFAPEPYRLLTTFGDFVLFKHSLANVVCEGRFDNDWNVPADAEAKLAATGTVSIRRLGRNGAAPSAPHQP